MTEILAEEVAADLCYDDACIYHGVGTAGCPVDRIERAVLDALRGETDSTPSKELR